MLTTDNPTMNNLLDQTLKGKDRQLLLVGAAGSPTESFPPAAINFTENTVEFLEIQKASVQRQLKNIDLALALVKVGLALKVTTLEDE